MTEFEEVQKATEKIFGVLNESRLTGMTIYYMLGNIQNMVLDQIKNPNMPEQEGEEKNE